MALVEGMFLFEVMVESVKSLIECKQFVIKSDFADIFSLELQDPKQLNILLPEPSQLPPEPPGKGKKKPKAKPKPKGKKGKAVVEEPTKEVVIQSGQSVLFACSAEFLIQSMKKSALELSLWDKEERLIYIGSNCIPWDEMYIEFLTKIANCGDPQPVTVKDEYNIFEEETAKLVAKLGIQIKLSFLKDKVTTSFRTLSEDASMRKYLYTGLNSKTTSYMCTMKTNDKIFIENSNKVENNFVVDKAKPIQYANFTNAPGTNVNFFNEEDYCCIKKADKLPKSKYTSPETMPDIDEICDYVRNIIVSCNDNMRMLTPRQVIRPRTKATDIYRLCHCQQTDWPNSELAQRMQKEISIGQCTLCNDKDYKREVSHGATFDIANIRGLCGKTDCKIARDLRSYIEKLVEEDKKEININEIIGPCGSKSCTLAEKVQEFLRHEGVFSKPTNLEGLSTQCGCEMTMKNALLKKNKSCQSICSKACDNTSESGGSSVCKGAACPNIKKNYDIFYFSVKYDKDGKSTTNSSKQPSQSSSSEKFLKYKYCDSGCPNAKESYPEVNCSKSACSLEFLPKAALTRDSKSHKLTCPQADADYLSPPDSNIVLNIDDIHNPCCVKSCDVADKVKSFIVDNWEQNNKNTTKEDLCYCDCVCDLNFSRKTTYCAVCGGYEARGDDIDDQPEYARPHPCPVYNKLYDKRKIIVPSPWGDNVDDKIELSGKVEKKMSNKSQKDKSDKESNILVLDDEEYKVETKKKNEKNATKKNISVPDRKSVAKILSQVDITKKPTIQKRTIISVPKNMGWLWNAENVPGMKPRPNWKPGASLKGLVRRYRAMRGSVDVIAKKKRALMQKRKKLEMKPTLVIKKKDGEYKVQMEVLKKYSKERLLFQYPYEDKPPVTYTVGKTEEEVKKIMTKRERKERRETRRKCKLLQSTFRDRCQEICLKAYNQAIGVLAKPNLNNPGCPCDVDGTYIGSPQINSCSCSDEHISSSDTDGDDWTIEFTPPAARWDIRAKHPPLTVDNDSQYNYMDYKVKTLDKSGNPVPRFFKGPDGKQECSDLGGFWGPGHVWLEINRDGYIGVDNRWTPMNFTGPDGMLYSAEDGAFTDNTGQLLKLGIDGYIDKDGKWLWYPKQRRTKMKTISSPVTCIVKSGKKTPIDNKYDNKKSKHIVTKNDKEVKVKPATQKSINREIKVSKRVVLKNSPFSKSKQVMSMVSICTEEKSQKRQVPPNNYKIDDSMRLGQYKDIMGNRGVYYETSFRQPILKSNRACNTKKVSLFTML